jgi:hypothetical protein
MPDPFAGLLPQRKRLQQVKLCAAERMMQRGLSKSEAARRCGWTPRWLRFLTSEQRIETPRDDA